MALLDQPVAQLDEPVWEEADGMVDTAVVENIALVADGIEVEVEVEEVEQEPPGTISTCPTSN